MAYSLTAQSGLITLLRDGWNSANTDGETPVIDRPVDMKIVAYSGKDTIQVDIATELIKSISMYSVEYSHTVPIAFDIYTRFHHHDDTMYDHIGLMISEVVRILKANPRLSGYAIAFNEMRIRQLDKDQRSFAHFVIETNLLKIA